MRMGVRIWIQKLMTTTLSMIYLFINLFILFINLSKRMRVRMGVQKLMRTNMERTWMVLFSHLFNTFFNYPFSYIDHGEDVDGLVALRPAVDPDQPDRPRYQPGDLEDDVD